METERLAALETMSLKYGSHPNVEAGLCAMEAVAWLAGEDHSDSPACVDPGIAAAVRKLNDRMPTDKMRTELLRPLLPKLIGSRTDDVVLKRRRAFIAADMACRVFAPMALEARGKLDLANELRALTEITDRKTAIEARDKCRSAAAYAAAAAAAYAAADAAAAAYAAAAAAAYADAARKAVFVEGVRMIERMLAA
jgi:hypothetical protein